MLKPVPTGWSMNSRSYFRFHAPVQDNTNINDGCHKVWISGSLQGQGSTAMCEFGMQQHWL